MTGIELIAFERQEQLEKHKRSVVADVEQNKEYQLIHAAQELAYRVNLNPGMSVPNNWDLAIWTKMVEKPHLQRLIIAGALIAAEIDRQKYVKNKAAQ